MNIAAEIEEEGARRLTVAVFKAAYVHACTWEEAEGAYIDRAFGEGKPTQGAPARVRALAGEALAKRFARVHALPMGEPPEQALREIEKRI